LGARDSFFPALSLSFRLSRGWSGEWSFRAVETDVAGNQILIGLMDVPINGKGG